MKTYGFDYNEYREAEKLSEVEEKVIKDHFQDVVDGNDIFEDKSSPEMDEFFYLFRHGWICRGMI